MKKLYKYFINVRKDLLLLFFIAFVTYLLIELGFNNYSEIFRGANKIGQFVSKLCISYVSSFIFYFIVVHIKNEKDKKNINRRISREASMIIIIGYRLFNNLSKDEILKERPFPPTIEQVEKFCSEANAFNSPMQINNRKNVTWNELLLYKKRDTKEHIKKIFELLPYLDSKLVSILNQIEDIGIFHHIETWVSPAIKTESFKDLTSMKKAFYEYFIIINMLNSYCDSKFVEFIDDKKLREKWKLI